MEADYRTLVVINYSEEGDQSSVAIAPHNVDFVIGSVADYQIQGRPLKRVNVYFSDGNSIEIHISELDLHQIQQAIATYAF